VKSLTAIDGTLSAMFFFLIMTLLMRFLATEQRRIMHRRCTP
jgi:hypothetical protein